MEFERLILGAFLLKEGRRLIITSVVVDLKWTRFNDTIPILLRM